VRADWNVAIGRLPAEARAPLWREYADAVNRRLLEDWLAARRFRRVLKTDAYDEAVGRGLAAALPGYARTSVWMDLAPLTLEQARRRNALDLLVGADVRRLPFVAGSFDLIFSGSTLDHLGGAGEIKAALGELARVLAPGGTLVLTLDNPRNPVVALRNALPASWHRKLRITPYPVGKTLGLRSLRAAMEGTGLRPVRWTAIAHCPRWPAVWLCRWLSSCRNAQRLPPLLLAFEALARWPTRYFTGYYLAVEAIKE